MGPNVKVHDTVDYLLWLLSDASAWLPTKTRNFLFDGIKKWAVWPWSDYSNDTDFPSNQYTGALSRALQKAKTYKSFKLNTKAVKDIETRLEFSIETLHLPNSREQIMQLFLESGAIEEWFRQRKKKA